MWVTAIDHAIGELVSEEDAGASTGYAPGPFSLADPALCTALLEGAGFVDATVDALDIPLAFGTVADAQAFLETWIDEDLDEAGRALATASLHRLLRENATTRRRAPTVGDLAHHGAASLGNVSSPDGLYVSPANDPIDSFSPLRLPR